MDATSSENPSVSIVGVGVVGGAMKAWFEGEGRSRIYGFHCYDRDKHFGSLEMAYWADVIFLCLPTPYVGDSFALPEAAREEFFRLNNLFNCSRHFQKTHAGGWRQDAIADTVQGLTELWHRDENVPAPKKTIVVHSTVLPGTTARLQSQYPMFDFLHVPEFLTERNAVEDFRRSTHGILIGIPCYFSPEVPVMPPSVEKVSRLLPPNSREYWTDSTETELVKLLTNAFLALKVTFANQVADFCDCLESVRSQVVLEMVGNDPRIGTSHFDVDRDGYRGYGGACLPKDVKGLLDFAATFTKAKFLYQTEKPHLSLLREMDGYNDALRASQVAKKDITTNTVSETPGTEPAEFSQFRESMAAVLQGLNRIDHLSRSVEQVLFGSESLPEPSEVEARKGLPTIDAMTQNAVSILESVVKRLILLNERLTGENE